MGMQAQTLVMAGVLRPHGLELAGGNALGGGAHSGGFGVVKDGDARRGKALHGAHAHTDGHDGVDAGVGEDTYGPHAAALLVRGIGDGTLDGDLTVLDVQDREAVGVAEVGGALGLEAAFANGGNCEFHVQCHLSVRVWAARMRVDFSSMVARLR